jgi:hypothetical protein
VTSAEGVGGSVGRYFVLNLGDSTIGGPRGESGGSWIGVFGVFGVSGGESPRRGARIHRGESLGRGVEEGSGGSDIGVEHMLGVGDGGENEE